jgi:hypothetical protein
VRTEVVKVYHVTTPDCACMIEAQGFRDSTGTYMTDREWAGVWLSDRPLDSNEGAAGTVTFEIELDETAIQEFEWIEEGKTYREWLVPAAIVNNGTRVRLEI